VQQHDGRLSVARAEVADDDRAEIREFDEPPGRQIWSRNAEVIRCRIVVDFRAVDRE